MLGLVAGATANLVVGRFLWPALLGPGALSPAVAALVVVLFALLQGLRSAALGALTSLGLRAGLPLPLSFLASLLVAERWPVLFDWSFSLALHDQLALAQAAALGGAPLVASLAAGGSVAAAGLVRAAVGRPWPVRWSLAPVLGLAAATAAGGARAARLERSLAAEPETRVGLVHGAMAVSASEQGAPDVEAAVAMGRVHRSLEGEGAALVVWPETSLPFPLREDSVETDALAQLPEARVGMLVGAVIEGPAGRTNSALLVASGRVQGRYDKRVLLPFGEYIPLERWLPWLRGFSPATGRFEVPAERGMIEALGRPLGVSICYEGALPERVREAARGPRAALLVNLTSDAWFEGTREPELHLAASRWRAIELGRYLVRATNRGESAVVGPTGRLLARASGGPARGLLAGVRWLDASTPFSRWGQAAAWVWVLLVGAVGWRRGEVAPG